MVAFSKILLVASAAATVAAAPAVSKPEFPTGPELTADFEATNDPTVADKTGAAASKPTYGSDGWYDWYDWSNYGPNDFPDSVARSFTSQSDTVTVPENDPEPETTTTTPAVPAKTEAATPTSTVDFDDWNNDWDDDWVPWWRRPSFWEIKDSVSHRSTLPEDAPVPEVTSEPEVTTTAPAVADKTEVASLDPIDDFRDSHPWSYWRIPIWDIPDSVSRRSTPRPKVAHPKAKSTTAQQATKPSRKFIIDGVKYNKIYTDGSQPNEEKTWGDVPKATDEEKKKHSKLRRDVGEEKDIHYVLDDIKAIDSSTQTLTNDLTSYEGGFWASLPLIKDLNTIYSYVYTSTEHTSVLPISISAGDCDFLIDLMKRTLDLDMKAAMSALKEKRDLFAKKGMDGHVVSGLELLQAAFGKLSAHMLDKAVEEKKKDIKEVMELIDLELRDALKEFERRDEEEEREEREDE